MLSVRTFTAHIMEENSLRSELENQQTHSWHLPDEMRIRILAGDEEAVPWFQAHLMKCAVCRDPIMRLALEIQGTAEPDAMAQAQCVQTRAALIRYLETGVEPDMAARHHLALCPICSEPFVDAAKQRALLEFDPDDTGEAG